MKDLINTGADWKYLDLVRRVTTKCPGNWSIGLNKDPLKVIVFRRDGIIIYVMPMRA